MKTRKLNFVFGWCGALLVLGITISLLPQKKVELVVSPDSKIEYIDLVSNGHHIPGALIAVTLRQPSRCRLTITDANGNISVGWDSEVIASKFLFPAGKNAAWISRSKPDWIHSVELEVWPVKIKPLLPPIDRR